jgi:hypothetical protein
MHSLPQLNAEPGLEDETRMGVCPCATSIMLIFVWVGEIRRALVHAFPSPGYVAIVSSRHDRVMKSDKFFGDKVKIFGTQSVVFRKIRSIHTPFSESRMDL